MVLAWLLFPALATVFCLGCGLLIDSVAGVRLSGPLLVPVGFALLVVATQLLTWRPETVPLAAPAVVVLALGGLAAGRKRLRAARPSWEVVTGCATFLAFAAPVLALGSATFGGYGQLGDSAVHFVLVDHLFSHGHDLAGVEPSTYRAVLDSYLRTGYPTGADTPLGAIRTLLPVDVAWLFQPYICVLAACFGLVAFDLLGAVFARPWIRAGAAFLASQSALVYAHAEQGSLKEIAAVALLAAAAALTRTCLALELGWRRLVPLAIVVAAAAAVLSFAALPTFGPLLLAQAGLTGHAYVQRRAVRAAFRDLAVLAIGALLLAAPVLAAERTFASFARSVLTASGELGNLLLPLQALEVFGVWPTGDHRVLLTNHVLEIRLLIAVVAGAALVGAARTVANRDLPAALFIGASCAGAGIVALAGGSPWAESKALMIASAGVLLAAVIGLAALSEVGIRPVALLAAVSIAFGVLWSNVRLYASFDPAPRARLVELEKTRALITAPALFLDFEESAKHFLRDRAVVAPDPFVPAGYVAPAHSYPFPVDSAELSPRSLAGFNTIIMRRSPFATRPPASFTLRWRGTWYELWRRSRRVVVTRHLALRSGGDGVSAANCARLHRITLTASPRVKIVASARDVPIVFDPARGALPVGWSRDETDPHVLLAGKAGVVDGIVRVPLAGRYVVWLEGSFGPPAHVTIDGREVGAVADQLDGRDDFTRLRVVWLRAGSHRVRLAVGNFRRRPGDGIPGERRLGRVVLQQARQPSELMSVNSRALPRLCSQSLDWLETVDSSGVR